MNQIKDARKKILVVDDEPLNLQVLRQILQQDYQLIFARDGEKAIALAMSEAPHLLLLDIMMPGLTGLEVCKILKSNAKTKNIPIIFVTALADVNDESEGFQAGCVDYVTKPISAPIVQARVKAQLSLVGEEELLSTRLRIIQTLGRAAEYKDNETGMHVIRMSHYSKELALAANLSKEHAELILNAAPMHDVGKMGIPDSILRKPAKLTDDEWIVMKQHTQIGAEIIGDDPSDVLQMAKEIALYHHEKWDGSGYPFGLSGDSIPLEARIVAIADVFDALTSRRPYKEPWSVDDAIALIERESAKHFDPSLVPSFKQALPKVLEIMQKFAG